MTLLMATIARAAHLDRNAKRDYALIKGSYLLACRSTRGIDGSPLQFRRTTSSRLR